MDIIIKKYGGTSVANIAQMQHIATQIQDDLGHGKKVICVVSAISGETDKLINLAKSVCAENHFDNHNVDFLISNGENISAGLFSLILNQLSIKAIAVNGLQIPILTTNTAQNARIIEINPDFFYDIFEEHQVIVVTGFQGLNLSGLLSTLGRGGSDTTALAIAASMGLKFCEILTDVDYIYNIDPKLHATPQAFDIIPSEIMLESASLGAKVLQVRSCELAYRHGVNIQLRSSFNYHLQGTFVMNNTSLENYPIINFTNENNCSYFVIKAFHNIAKLYSICNIDMLSFNHAELSCAVTEFEAAKLRHFLSYEKISYTETANLNKVSLIGSGFRSNQDLLSDIWGKLNGLQIICTKSSELSLSLLIQRDDLVNIIDRLHDIIVAR